MRKTLVLLSLFVWTLYFMSCMKKKEAMKIEEGIWEVDFLDEFETFNSDNWQDQLLWVNNETHCYVPDNKFGTQEVSDGTLKLKVVNIGKDLPCNNRDKYGKQHPDTRYVAGRICSKNKKEFVKGKWTARLKLSSNGEASMFPAWWLLGAQNNEPPVQEDNENVCWPLTGSGEIDIFEHHGDHLKDRFTTGAIKSLGECDKADWWSFRKDVPATLNEFHEYSVEWEGSDLVYRLDGKEVYRNEGEGDNYPEPMFAILNFAKNNHLKIWEGLIVFLVACLMCRLNSLVQTRFE